MINGVVQEKSLKAFLHCSQDRVDLKAANEKFNLSVDKTKKKITANFLGASGFRLMFGDIREKPKIKNFSNKQKIQKRKNFDAMDTSFSIYESK